MKLYKHQNGLYYAQFCDTTRTPHLKRVYFTRNRRESASLLRDYLKRMSRGEISPWGDERREPVDEPTNPMPLIEAVDRFIEDRTASTRPDTVARYEWVIRPFAEALPKTTRVHEVTYEQIQEYCHAPRKRDGKPRSPASIKTDVDRMGIFFRWCAERGYIDSDPSALVASPSKKMIRSEKPYLTKAQASKLLQTIRAEAIPRHWWVCDLVEFDLLTGLRLAEINNLKWRHLTFTHRGGRITFEERDYYEIPLKSRDAIRHIKLFDRAAEIVDRLRKERGGVRPDDHVFIDDYGPLTLHDDAFTSKTVKRYLKKAGLDKMNFHALRHTAISWWVNGGVPINVAQRMAGHSDIRVTQGYLHANPLEFDTLIPEEVLKLRL